MLFSSIPFLFYFLPCTLLCYYIVPFRWKNFVLLLFSLVFYAWGEPIYILLMLVSIVLGYIEGRLIERQQDQKKAFWLTVFSCGLHIAFLIYFKYADFLLDGLRFAGASISLLKIALPLGISFYTFQLISYLIDVYQKKCAAQKSFVMFGAYISMFPQLIAGPIVRYADIAKQLVERKLSLEQSAQGMQRFVIGLSKKVLLANALGELCLVLRATQVPSVLNYWLYALAFALQIYYDFSGYSDMAIGLGKMMGFHFLENFNYPFIASSIREFWHRWHISLSTWFRDYVYIPLGGSRVSKSRWIINLCVVWLLTGLWHGASWNFVLWGILFAILLLLEKVLLSSFLKKHKILAHGYVILSLLVSFVIFDASTIQEALHTLSIMFTGQGLPLASNEVWYYIQSYGMVLGIAIIASTPLFHKLLTAWKKTKMGNTISQLLEPFVLLILLIIVTSCLINDSYNPFLYFRF